MELRTVETLDISFKCPITWDVEKADTLNNPDCVATLSKGQSNLINVVIFPTATNLDDYKTFMEDSISDDGGVIFKSEIVEIVDMDAINVHAVMNTPDISFDIHAYVFIENRKIYIFELRTVDVTDDSVLEFRDMIQNLRIKN